MKKMFVSRNMLAFLSLCNGLPYFHQIGQTRMEFGESKFENRCIVESSSRSCLEMLKTFPPIRHNTL